MAAFDPFLPLAAGLGSTPSRHLVRNDPDGTHAPPALIRAKGDPNEEARSMRASRPLDPKARLGLAILLVLVFAVLLVFFLKAPRVDRSVPGEQVNDVRLVEVGGDTMVLAPGSIERRLADWLRIGDETTFDFETGDQTFTPGAAKLTKSAEDSIVRFAALMKKHPSLKMHILTPVGAPDVVKLGEQRAALLRSGMLGQGVPETRLKIEKKDETRTASEGSNLVIVLSK